MASVPRRLQFKAVLVDSMPPIWRTIDVDPTLTLDGLHEVLQVAFGWAGYHLHEFSTARPYSRPQPGGPELRRWGPPGDDDPELAEWGVPKLLDERRSPLGRALSAASSPLYYLYDFGDDWSVRLDFIESRIAQEDEPPARIVKAKLRGPTEDSGGIWGWEEKRRLLADPSDPAYKSTAAWIREVDAGRWPVNDVVDLDALNKELSLLLRRHQQQ